MPATEATRNPANLEQGNLIPKEIKTLIDHIYRSTDPLFVKSRLVYSDRWLTYLKSIAGGFVIVDETDFNYGRAYRHDLWLTKDVRASVHSREIQDRMVSELGRVESVSLSVSVLVPYFMLHFQTCEATSDGTLQRFGLYPESEAQGLISDQIDHDMCALGYVRLIPEVAKIVVPDIETELAERGTVTVEYCVMGH